MVTSKRHKTDEKSTNILFLNFLTTPSTLSKTQWAGLKINLYVDEKRAPPFCQFFGDWFRPKTIFISC